MTCRFFLVLLILAATGCASNGSDSKTGSGASQTAQTPDEEQTSWYCEDAAGTWACKRRTMSEIKALQEAKEARASRVMDWSAPTATDEKATEAQFSSASSNPGDPIRPVVPRTQPTAVPLPERDPSSEVSTADPADWVVNQDQQTTALDPALPTYVRLMYRPEKTQKLEDLPPSFYTMQLVALSSGAELRKFMAELALEGLTGAMIKVQDTTFYVALLGTYETRAIAEQAAAARPDVLKDFEPYIRSLGSLQAAMEAASAL